LNFHRRPVTRRELVLALASLRIDPARIAHELDHLTPDDASVLVRRSLEARKARAELRAERKAARVAREAYPLRDLSGELVGSTWRQDHWAGEGGR